MSATAQSTEFVNADILYNKYAVAGSLIAGGCFLFWTGYHIGSRKRKQTSPLPSSQPPAEIKDLEESKNKPLVQSPSSVAGDLERVSSVLSLASTDDSERGSPMSDTYRCALVVRKDCKLARAKIIIHSCRAFLAEFKKLYKQKNPDLKAWENDGMTVVVLRADSEAELIALKARATEMHVTNHIFSMKQSDGSSLRSVMAIGPARTLLIKDLTQHLMRI